MIIVNTKHFLEKTNLLVRDQLYWQRTAPIHVRINFIHATDCNKIGLEHFWF